MRTRLRKLRKHFQHLSMSEFVKLLELSTTLYYTVMRTGPYFTVNMNKGKARGLEKVVKKLERKVGL